MKHINIPIFIPHLGCPFACLFCNQRRISAAQAVNPSDIIAIIEEHLETVKHSERQVELAFFGGSFTAIAQTLQESYLEAVQPYLRRGLISSIRISTRPDCINAANLRVLAGWGVRTIELGVQSFSDVVLKASARGYLSADVFKACHLIREQGFKLGLQLMIGLPGDTYQQDMKSALQAIDLRPDMVRIYPTLVISATALEQMYAKGIYTPLSLKEAVKTTAAMFKQFQAHDIPVIRMGLQPNAELRSTGTVIAGPFHPAFGELVEQEVCKEQASKAINTFFNLYGSYKAVNLWVNPRDISKMTGHKRQTIYDLQESFHLDQLLVRQIDNLLLDTVGVSTGSAANPSLQLTRSQFLKQ
ncbi:MAG: radical SAM protein [Syntrophomonadaceae bacterium]|nr:radical SAM protein [Syntrophomonadaceae bacterium]